MAKSVTFIDTEVGADDHKIHDIGAVRQDRASFHAASIREFAAFVEGTEYICGHNILHHDLKYLQNALGYELPAIKIDTLYLSPLLFPKRPYYRRTAMKALSYESRLDGVIKVAITVHPSKT